MTLMKLQVKGSTTECITVFIISEMLFFQNYIQIAEEGINKMWCIHTHTHTHTHIVEYNSAIKRNEIVPFAEAWMDLKTVV